ncbi:hypothetical protein ACLOJK_038069 [Asimina triloba]
MAPEYAMHGKFSTKSDVFSFGVILLEIVSGLKNYGFHQSDLAQDLPSYAWKHWTERTLSELIDPTLAYCCPRMEAMRFIHIGLLCVQEHVAERPTMSSVVHMLSNDSINLPSPSPPVFSVMNKAHADTTEEECDSPASNSDRKKKMNEGTKRYVLRLFISLKHITANVVDRNNGRVVVSASSVEHAIKEAMECGRSCNAKAAAAIGEVLAMRLKVEGIGVRGGGGADGGRAVHAHVDKDIEKKGFKNRTKVRAIINALKSHGINLVIHDSQPDRPH